MFLIFWAIVRIPLEAKSFKNLLCRLPRIEPLGKCSAFGGKFKLLHRAPCGGCCVVFSDPPRRRAGSVRSSDAFSLSVARTRLSLAFLQSYDEEIHKQDVRSLRHCFMEEEGEEEEMRWREEEERAFYE